LIASIFARALSRRFVNLARMTESEPLEIGGLNEVRVGNRALIHFSGCDYFRLARDPRLATAAKKNLDQTGLNVAASRLTTGERKIYRLLESELAKFFGAESAVLLPDGYLAGIAVAQALTGEFTHAFVDELAHVAVLDAARMFDCPIKKFPHRNPAALAKLIFSFGGASVPASRRARPIILTDGMFAHDGSVAPLREYLKILPPGGMILVDDAHGAGVLGRSGRGALELEGVSRRCIIQCVTLSKAFGAFGGVALVSRALREKILSRSRSFGGSTPLPPPLAGAALEALKILRREPARRQRLFQNLAYLRTKLRAAGWTIPETPGPIVRLPVMNEEQILELKKHLLAAGILPPFFQYPGASARGAFRFVISSEHHRAHLDKLAATLAAFKNRSN
jgi:7-keto-8-aminopelargonate synthetase-like enzyme